MSDHNLKAIYFCHTHPNLFLQQHCKSCRRGMCHTCIANNSEYCQSCLKQNFRSSTQYEDRQMVLRMFISGIIVSIMYITYQLSFSELINPIQLILWFCLGVSVTSMYYISTKTDVFSETSKVPFIGGKLAIALIVLTTLSGGPFLFFIYKAFLIGKSIYLKQR